ncbi:MULTISPECIES: AAA family ATPase [unclassified Streptomyces]|uniref:helix-turn-helix transcriptional regulator n=1 Tax=unclassified Streptomyces TaxID=2593676 RepID=UPI0033B49080
MTAPRNQPAHGGLDFGAAFTGRQNELRELRAAVERARTGAASIVLVQGAPGTGKTTLVHHFLAELGEFMVLTTAATPSARPAAFDCLSRLLRPVTVPAQGLPGPGPRYGPAGGDPSAFGPRPLWRLLDSPSADPLVLFVDDAHWADGPTLRSLAEAVREGGRLCVVLAARRSRTWDAETQQALQSVHPVSLGELGEGDAASLVGSVLGEAADHALTRRLLLRSGRHPLYLRGLLAGHDTARPAEGSWPARLPATVVQRQLRGVPAASTEALEALAVLGGSASVPTLGAVLGAPDCAAALDPLAHEEFIARTFTPVPTVTIRHAAFRDALYDAIPSARRRSLHLAAAAAVDWRHGLAHKMAAAETVDAQLVTDLLELVAHELREGRVLYAARMLLSAARLSGTDDHLSDHLLYGAVRALFWAGADTEISQYANAVATRRPCPWRDEALGLAEFAAGRLTSARRLLDRAQQSLRTRHAAQHAVVLTELAMVQALLGQGEAAHRHAEQALGSCAPDGTTTSCAPAAAARDDDCAHAHGRAPDIVVPPGTDRAARALSAFGAALWRGPAAGLALLAALPEDADEISEEDLPGLTVRGFLRLADGNLPTATTDLTMAVVRSRPGGPRLLGVSASLHLAMCHLLNGDWERATRGIESALDDEQARSCDTAALWSLRSVIEAFRGDETAAETCLARAHELAQQLDFAGPQYHTAMARSMNARARGDHRGVVAALQVLAAHADHSERVRVVAACWLPFLAESLIVCGLADFARAAMSDLRAAHVESNLLLTVADGWLHGRLAEAAGDGETAVLRYTEAIDALRPGRDIPLLRGLLQSGCGRASAALGRADTAAGHFASAEEIFTRLGARAFLAENRAQRQASAPAPVHGPGQERLTGREREVTRLVGLGHTNKEIADELMLSAKTIEYHLRSVFGKLGVHNRKELRRHVQAGGV